MAGAVTVYLDLVERSLNATLYIHRELPNHANPDHPNYDRRSVFQKLTVELAHGIVVVAVRIANSYDASVVHREVVQNVDAANHLMQRIYNVVNVVIGGDVRYDEENDICVDGELSSNVLMDTMWEERLVTLAFDTNGNVVAEKIIVPY